MKGLEAPLHRQANSQPPPAIDRAIENGTEQMSYQLLVDGRKLGTYEHPEDALDRVRTLMMCDCNAEPEVLDTRTGHAFEVAASLKWREELASKIGY